jgi:hypothetical protein
MFHWICPECGREIPPAMKVCPACDPQPEQAATPAAPAPEAIAVTVSAPPAPAPIAVPVGAAVLSSAPELKTLAELFNDAPDSMAAMAECVRRAQVSAEKPAVSQAELAPQLLGLAAAVGVSEAPTLEMIPVPAVAEPALVAVGARELAQPVALLAPPELRGAPAPVGLAEPISDTAPPLRTSLVQAAPVALADPPPLIPELPAYPVENREEEPVVSVPLVEPVSAGPSEVVEERREELAPPPAPLAEAVPHYFRKPSVRQLPQTPPDLKTEPMGQVGAPPVPETPADMPPSGSWLKFAPLQDYSAAATRSMRPAAPSPRILTPDSGPRITLPGPALPPLLNVRENLRVLTVKGETPKGERAIPGWVISFLVMAGLLAIGVGIVAFLVPASHTTADAKTAAPEPAVVTPTIESSHPLAQFIEVTGFRFVMDLNKKSEIHYLVVNHSGAELSDMTVYVTVHAANSKAGQAPLCRFSFRSTGLGPYESKEMISPIEKLARPVTLPDWHDLHADVQIAQ